MGMKPGTSLSDPHLLFLSFAFDVLLQAGLQTEICVDTAQCIGLVWSQRHTKSVWGDQHSVLRSSNYTSLSTSFGGEKSLFAQFCLSHLCVCLFSEGLHSIRLALWCHSFMSWQFRPKIRENTCCCLDQANIVVCDTVPFQKYQCDKLLWGVSLLSLLTLAHLKSMTYFIIL